MRFSVICEFSKIPPRVIGNDLSLKRAIFYCVSQLHAEMTAQLTNSELSANLPLIYKEFYLSQGQTDRSVSFDENFTLMTIKDIVIIFDGVLAEKES